MENHKNQEVKTRKKNKRKTQNQKRNERSIKLKSKSNPQNPRNPTTPATKKPRFYIYFNKTEMENTNNQTSKRSQPSTQKARIFPDHLSHAIKPMSKKDPNIKQRWLFFKPRRKKHEIFHFFLGKR